MMFHRTRIKNEAPDDIVTVHPCGINLVSVKNTNILGVIIYSKLNWSDHIAYIKNKISKSIGILIKIRRFLNKKTEKFIFFICLSISHLLCWSMGKHACYILRSSN